MKVRIDRDRDGWHLFADTDDRTPPLATFSTYPQAKRGAAAAGHEVRSGGWLHRLLMWNWNNHALDGFPEWEIDREKMPAFAELTHIRSKGDVESHTLAAAWDDVAEVDFYQRDRTDDGIPFVREGDGYCSLWWFATIAERDRFVTWAAKHSTSRLAVEERRR